MITSNDLKSHWFVKWLRDYSSTADNESFTRPESEDLTDSEKNAFSVAVAAVELLLFMRASDDHFTGVKEDPKLKGCSAARFWWNRERVPERIAANEIFSKYRNRCLRRQFLTGVLLRLFFREQTMRLLDAEIFSKKIRIRRLLALVRRLRQQGLPYGSGAYQFSLDLPRLKHCLSDIFRVVPELASSKKLPTRREVYTALLKCKGIGPLTAMLASADFVYYGLIRENGDDLDLKNVIRNGSRAGMNFLNIEIEDLPQLKEAIEQQGIAIDMITLEHALCKIYRYQHLRSSKSSAKRKQQACD